MTGPSELDLGRTTIDRKEAETCAGDERSLGHRLRNALAVFQGVSRLLGKKPDVSPRLHARLESQLARLERLTGEILEVTEPGNESLSISSPEPPSQPLPPLPAELVVLVVDDLEDGADTLAELLAQAGCTAEVAYTGASALQQIARQAPHVVLLDLGLPDQSGIEVARRIRARGDSPPLLIALTGYGHPGSRGAALEAGIDEVLLKPVDFEKLMALLHEAARFRL